MENYARFFALLKKLPWADKKELIYRFTDGRTQSLRSLSDGEYEYICQQMEKLAGSDEDNQRYRDELRRGRGRCLYKMQALGIDTTDWARVDAFCQDKRIAGQRFGKISPGGLLELEKKLRAIERHGGLRQFAADAESAPRPCGGSSLTTVMLCVPIAVTEKGGAQ